jgi:hypothetical protein
MHWEITEYKVATYSMNPAGYLLCAIALFDASGSHVGTIFFYRNDYELPPAGLSGSTVMRFHISEMPLIVDMLRNESPIFLFTSDGMAHLGTMQEAIGEGEA